MPSYRGGFNYGAVEESACDLAEPLASPLCESLRAFGYELPSAVADLIDNSIFASATNVWVDFFWDGANSHVAITDDGAGMTLQKLIDAMRPGSRNPLETRDPKDLGRYGLGLKTASFSQCRVLTVRTKTESGDAITRRWDLDFISNRQKWLLLRESNPDVERAFSRLDDLESGTCVVWENIDRLCENNTTSSEDERRIFLGRVEEVEQHLGMVFHRFLEGPPRLAIFINGNKVKPWDPFMKKERATQQIADEAQRIVRGTINVVPYILPHVSKMSAEAHNRGAGPKGWNHQQGFYVYRNERLLVPGSWLGLPFAKEEHCKLARIQLDIPNSMDHEWEIDVTKSKASPPAALRRWLREIATKTRTRASEVYRHRGKVVARSSSAEHVFVWSRKTVHGKYTYEINRSHPVIKKALESGKDVEFMLKVIESSFPVSLVSISNADKPDGHAEIGEGLSTTEISKALKLQIQDLQSLGFSLNDIFTRLAGTEPFDHFPEVIQAIKEEMGIL